jgi:hypothetical protein
MHESPSRPARREAAGDADAAARSTAVSLFSLVFVTFVPCFSCRTSGFVGVILIFITSFFCIKNHNAHTGVVLLATCPESEAGSAESWLPGPREKRLWECFVGVPVKTLWVAVALVQVDVVDG